MKSKKKICAVFVVLAANLLISTEAQGNSQAAGVNQNAIDNGNFAISNSVLNDDLGDEEVSRGGNANSCFMRRAQEKKEKKCKGLGNDCVLEDDDISDNETMAIMENSTDCGRPLDPDEMCHDNGSPKCTCGTLLEVNEPDERLLNDKPSKGPNYICGQALKLHGCSLSLEAEHNLTRSSNKTHYQFSKVLWHLMQSFGINHPIPDDVKKCLDCVERPCRSCARRKQILANLFYCNATASPTTVLMRKNALWNICAANRNNRRCPTNQFLCNDATQCYETDFCTEIGALRSSCPNRDPMYFKCVPVSCGVCKSMYTYKGMEVNMTDFNATGPCVVDSWMGPKPGIAMDGNLTKSYCRCAKHMKEDRSKARMKQQKGMKCMDPHARNIWINTHHDDDDHMDRNRSGNSNSTSRQRRQVPNNSTGLTMPDPDDDDERPNMTCSTDAMGGKVVLPKGGRCITIVNPTNHSDIQFSYQESQNKSHMQNCHGYCRNGPNDTSTRVHLCCDHIMEDGLPCNAGPFIGGLDRMIQEQKCGHHCGKQYSFVDSICEKCMNDWDCGYTLKCSAGHCVPPVKGNSGDDRMEMRIPKMARLESTKALVDMFKVEALLGSCRNKCGKQRSCLDEDDEGPLPDDGVVHRPGMDSAVMPAKDGMCCIPGLFAGADGICYAKEFKSNGNYEKNRAGDRSDTKEFIERRLDNPNEPASCDRNPFGYEDPSEQCEDQSGFANQDCDNLCENVDKDRNKNRPSGMTSPAPRRQRRQVPGPTGGSRPSGTTTAKPDEDDDDMPAMNLSCGAWSRERNLESLVLAKKKCVKHMSGDEGELPMQCRRAAFIFHFLNDTDVCHSLDLEDFCKGSVPRGCNAMYFSPRMLSRNSQLCGRFLEGADIIKGATCSDIPRLLDDCDELDGGNRGRLKKLVKDCSEAGMNATEFCMIKRLAACLYKEKPGHEGHGHGNKDAEKFVKKNRAEAEREMRNPHCFGGVNNSVIQCAGMEKVLKDDLCLTNPTMHAAYLPCLTEKVMKKPKRGCDIGRSLGRILPCSNVSQLQIVPGQEVPNEILNHWCRCKNACNVTTVNDTCVGYRMNQCGVSVSMGSLLRAAVDFLASLAQMLNEGFLNMDQVVPASSRIDIGAMMGLGDVGKAVAKKMSRREVMSMELDVSNAADFIELSFSMSTTGRRAAEARLLVFMNNKNESEQEDIVVSITMKGRCSRGASRKMNWRKARCSLGADCVATCSRGRVHNMVNRGNAKRFWKNFVSEHSGICSAGDIYSANMGNADLMGDGCFMAGFGDSVFVSFASTITDAMLVNLARAQIQLAMKGLSITERLGIPEYLSLMVLDNDVLAALSCTQRKQALAAKPYKVKHRKAKSKTRELAGMVISTVDSCYGTGRLASTDLLDLSAVNSQAGCVLPTSRLPEMGAAMDESYSGFRECCLSDLANEYIKDNFRTTLMAANSGGAVLDIGSMSDTMKQYFINWCPLAVTFITEAEAALVDGTTAQACRENFDWYQLKRMKKCMPGFKGINDVMGHRAIQGFVTDQGAMSVALMVYAFTVDLIGGIQETDLAQLDDTQLNECIDQGVFASTAFYEASDATMQLIISRARNCTDQAPNLYAVFPGATSTQYASCVVEPLTQPGAMDRLAEVANAAADFITQAVRSALGLGNSLLRQRRNTDDCSGTTEDELVGMESTICHLSDSCIDTLDSSALYGMAASDSNPLLVDDITCDTATSRKFLARFSSDVFPDVTSYGDWTGDEPVYAGVTVAQMTGAEMAQLPTSAIPAIPVDIFDLIPFATLQDLKALSSAHTAEITGVQALTLSDSEAATLGVTQAQYDNGDYATDPTAAGVSLAGCMFTLILGLLARFAAM